MRSFIRRFYAGGISYLRKMLDVVLFPEIWKLQTSL
jgi:tryptophan 2,3-dioxygenase